ncbi:MAG: transposase [Desulfobulbaceae bacterium]|nr:transposase [Desulfobulbaceae bacterium]
MARIGRVVIPNYPHHITQRGNRRQEVFFSDDDYQAYLDLMAEWCLRCKVQIWAYCLMPNHVHLICVPKSEIGLARGIGEAHRRYTRLINFQQGWRGHLWQDRFASFVMDEQHLLTAARYVEWNPVKAGLVQQPGDYRWSSAAAHLAGENDALVKVRPLLKIAGNWADFLAPNREDEEELLRRHERTGRPLGSARFVGRVEKLAGRILAPQKPGPKRREGE